MDILQNGFGGNDRTPIINQGGLTLFASQVAGKIDSDWIFAANTGRHYTTQAPKVVSDDGTGNVRLSMQGWTVKWGICDDVDMGGGSPAVVSCFNGSSYIVQTDCIDSNYFTLDYTHTVPTGVFAGVDYALHLEGAISHVPLPTTLWLFASGLLLFARVVKV